MNISLYYKNVTAEVLGPEHGISREQFAEIAAKTNTAVELVNQARKDGKTPYRDLPHRPEYAASAKKLAAEISSACENFVVLGIGGSALGNIALQTALKPYLYNMDDKQRLDGKQVKRPRLFVLDNVDPAQLTSFLDWIGDNLDKTWFNVISKSGRTAETAAQYMILQEMLLKRMGSAGFREHVIATTDVSKGTMRQITNQYGFRSLEVPDGVGGRFSVLSPVGMLSAAVCGINIDALLAGAADMDQRVQSTGFYKNPAAILAGINHHYYQRGKRISVMMPYSYALKDLSDWYRQLWAESLGKAKNIRDETVYVGPTPVKALGATDQHSQVQLYREGPNDKIFTFLQVQEFSRDLTIGPAPDCAPELGYLAGAKMSKLINCEKLATEYALVQDQRPCMTVHFEKIDERTVGQFLYLYEVATSIAGRLFEINTYDQPAVELGKDVTMALMGHPDYRAKVAKIQPIVTIDPAYRV